MAELDCSVYCKECHGSSLNTHGGPLRAVLDILLTVRLQLRLADDGPCYAEGDLSCWRLRTNDVRPIRLPITGPGYSGERLNA